MDDKAVVVSHPYVGGLGQARPIFYFANLQKAVAKEFQFGRVSCDGGQFDERRRNTQIPILVVMR